MAKERFIGIENLKNIVTNFANVAQKEDQLRIVTDSHDAGRGARRDERWIL